MPVGTLITGSTVIIATDTFGAGVAIDGEEIVTVGDASSIPDATKTVDTEELLVMPGMIDLHVHIDDMFSIDTHGTASAAAALGGVTSYVDLVWQTQAGELSIFEESGTLLKGIERKRKRTANVHADYALHRAIIYEDPAVLPELTDAVGTGVSSFRMFTTHERGLSNGFIHTVMEEIADIDAVGVYHTEDALLIDTLAARSKTEGRDDSADYLQSQPSCVEAMTAEDTVRMAQGMRAKYYGIHASCRKSAEVLSQFRDDDSTVRAETYAHYTTLTDDVFETQGNLLMIAPPIRKQNNIETIFERLADGMLDVVSTDHCDCKRESKEVSNQWDPTFGANALQVSVPVFRDEAVDGRDFLYLFLARVMSRNPARTFGMSGKGTLDPGTDTDVILFDPEETYTITAEDNASNADFSIYEGREVAGRVRGTFVHGKLIADGSEIVSEPSHGECISRELPDRDAWDRQEGQAFHRLISFGM